MNSASTYVFTLIKFQSPNPESMMGTLLLNFHNHYSVCLVRGEIALSLDQKEVIQNFT